MRGTWQGLKTKLYAFLLASSALLLLSLLCLTLGLVNRQGRAAWILAGILLLLLSLALFWWKAGRPLLKLLNVASRTALNEEDALPMASVDIPSLADALDSMMGSLTQSIGREQAADILRQEAQIAMLQSQINPHFLYNTLEVIRSEALIQGNRTVADMTETLANYFRYNISKKGDVVRLEEEVDNVINYMRIQRYRFDERIHFKIDMHDNGEEVWHCLLPKLTLQPLIENAIYHGLEPKVEGGTVTLHICATEKRLILSVCDDGVGMDAEHLDAVNKALRFSKDLALESRESMTGIALLNINRRVKLLWGEDYGITVNGFPEAGTDVTMTLPYVREDGPGLEVGP